MTRFLESEAYKAKQAAKQADALDTVITDLMVIYQRRIGMLGLTELTETAKANLGACIQTLIQERNFRSRVSGKAIEQKHEQEFNQRLIGHGAVDVVEEWPGEQAE